MGKVIDWLTGRSHLNKDGSEVPDPRPVELPVGFERPETIQETIRRLVTDPQIRAELDGKDIETFDEADDFEVDEDDMPHSPHEDQFDPLHLLAREQEVRLGAVAARTPEEVAAANKFLADLRAKKDGGKPATKKAPPEEPAGA